MWSARGVGLLPAPVIPSLQQSVRGTLCQHRRHRARPSRLKWASPADSLGHSCGDIVLPSSAKGRSSVPVHADARACTCFRHQRVRLSPLPPPPPCPGSKGPPTAPHPVCSLGALFPAPTQWACSCMEDPATLQCGHSSIPRKTVTSPAPAQWSGTAAT